MVSVNDVEDPDRESEAAYMEQVHRDLPRNFTAHVLHGLLGQTGFRLVNAPTFLPAYVLMLSGSEFVVGLCRAIQYLGMFLSPLLGASLIEHRRRVLPVGFVVGFGMRLQVLGIALAGFFLAPWATVVAICVFLFFFGFLMGMQGVIFNVLMSKVIPVERRGFLVGIRTTLAGATAAGVAYLGGRYLVEPDVLGNGYAVTFLVSFVLTCLGLMMLLAVREPEPPQVRAASSLRSRLGELPTLLRGDRAFTWYFVARALATMGRMAVPFYIAYVGDVIGVMTAAGRGIPTGAAIGVLSTAFIVANSATNFAWGLVADRTGFRLVFLASIWVWIAGALGILVAGDLWGFAAGFVGVGAGMGGFQMAAQNMALEFGSRADLPVRIALANSAQEFMGFLGPLLGGLIAVVLSKEWLFAIAIAFQLSAIAVVLLYVDEPRRRPN
ncbi:MAG: MFS transporter [bacterium]|nr:MFS transporter [bacterium]